MEKTITSKDWLILSVFTFLTVAIWTVYDIYHVVVTSTITPVQKELISPLTPNLDAEVINILKSKNI